jgi:lantibiotic modifying enzyme
MNGKDRLMKRWRDDADGEARLNRSPGLKVVHKPRSLSLDVHIGEFLEWVNQSGLEPAFRTPKIIDRGCYGWSEFVAHQPCSSRDEVDRYYQRLGGYLAVFYVFRATNMHFENLIAAGEFPVPVDLETLFHPDVEDKEDPATAASQSSVMRVLFLPVRFGSETQEPIDISGLRAKSGEHRPAGTLPSWERPGTDEMRLVHDKAMLINVVGNRPGA